jgi:lactoylglutathione lyase
MDRGGAGIVWEPVSEYHKSAPLSWRPLGVLVMMFGKLGLVMVVVRDMERSVAFYRDVLGLKLLIHQPNWSQFDAGNILIGLHPDGEEVKVSPTTGMSIGIYVDDMDKAVTEIRRRFGKIAVGPRQDPFGRWALVFDPDGYSIQIIEMARGLRAQHKLPPQPSQE